MAFFFAFSCWLCFAPHISQSSKLTSNVDIHSRLEKKKQNKNKDSLTFPKSVKADFNCLSK